MKESEKVPLLLTRTVNYGKRVTEFMARNSDGNRFKFYSRTYGRNETLNYDARERERERKQNFMGRRDRDVLLGGYSCDDDDDEDHDDTTMRLKKYHVSI